MDTRISRRQLLNTVGAAGGAAAVHAAATALGLLPAVARARQLALRPAGAGRGTSSSSAPASPG